MKIYTEVVYAWDDNKGELVEESSKSFDYEGEVTQCHSRRGGNRYTGYFNIPHSHWEPPKPKITLPPIVVPEIKLPDVITDTLGDVGSGITTTLGDASGTLQTNLEGAASGVSEGLKTGTSAARAGLHAATDAGRTNLHVATDAGRAFLHEGADFLKAGWDKLRGKKRDPGSSTTVGSTASPGTSSTMGQGGKDLMKGAALAFTRKKTVGSGGKRRLTKIKKKGSSGARV